MWLGKFMVISGINGYYVILRGNVVTLSDNEDESKYQGLTPTLKLPNKNSYNKIILSREYTICFRNFEEAKTERLKCGITRRAWEKQSRNSDPTTGDSKTML